MLSGFLFVNTLYLQEVRGDSALTTGLSLLPATIGIAGSAVLSGRLVARYGPRLPWIVAGGSIAAGAFVLLGLTPNSSFSLLVVSYVLLGLGFGLINPPITNTAVTGMPADQAGVASAIVSTSRQVGSLLGIAIMGTLVSSGSFHTGRLSHGGSIAFTSATHRVWILAICCGLGCSFAAMLSTSRRGLEAAARVYQDPGFVAPGELDAEQLA